MNIWLVLVVSILPILLFTNLTKKFRDDHPETFSYIISLVATFVGIVIGLYVNDWQGNRDKTNKMIKILEASKQEINWTINRTEKLKSIADTTSRSVLINFLNLQLPPFFSETLRTEIASEVIHPLAFEEFNLIREQLILDAQWISSTYANKKNAELDTKLNEYKYHLELTNVILNAEIKRLSGKISIVDFNKELKAKIDSTIQ
jgi:hypothetical protein